MRRGNLFDEMHRGIVKYLSKEKLIITVLSAGALVRLHKLTFSSIWHDEGYTMWLVRYNFLEIIERTARDVHPPAYYLILKPWLALFGNSELSARSLSVIFSLGLIWLVYKIVYEIWSKEAAFWASLFVALSPFMVRFAQEARMYGVVAFFTTLAAYFFVKYLKEGQGKWLVGYALAGIIACYTQYYAFFALGSLGVAALLFTRKNRGLLDWRWWAAHLTILLAYLPWFPVAYRQVTRVSGSYWIRPEWITVRTIPSSIFQFISYSHWDQAPEVVYWLAAGALILSAALLFLAPAQVCQRAKGRLCNSRTALSLIVFGYLPMVLVFAISKIKTPVYQDRYFPFSATAIFIIWGVLITLIKNKYLKAATVALALTVLIKGNITMHKQVNHQMRAAAAEIKSQKQVGDIVLSAELYSFLDSSYYLGDKNIKLISQGVDGYGESSLFYDQQKDYLAAPAAVPTLGKRIWILARSSTDSPHLSPNFLPNFSHTSFETGDLKWVLFEQK